MDDLKQKQLPCPICGASEYEWGVLRADNLFFEPRNPSFFAQLFKTTDKIRARKCENCGNVQIFAEPEKP